MSAPLRLSGYFGLYALALAVRLVYVGVAARADAFRGLFLDSAYYVQVAAEIRAGNGAGDTPYLLSPLYPYFLALFPGVEAAPETNALLAARIAQALIGAGTAVLAALLAGAMAPSAQKVRATYAAGIACALFGPLVHYDTAILVAGLQGFFLTLGILLVTRDTDFVDRRVDLRLAAAGVAFGVSAGLRPTGLAVVAALCVLLAVEKRLRHAALVFLGAAVVVVPFAIRNHVVSGESVLLSANGGWNFWIGNHADSPGVYNKPPGSGDVFGSEEGSGALGLQNARAELGDTAGYEDASAWWRDRAIADIRADPAGWVRLVVFKALLLVHPSEIPQMGFGYAWHARNAWPLRLPLDARWLVLFAIAATVLADAETRKRMRRPAASLFVYSGVVVLFFVAGRLRAPILPALVAFAAVGAVATWDGLRARKPRALFALALVLLGGGATQFVYGGEGHLNLAPSTGIEERQIGMSLAVQGRFEEAIQSFDASLEIADLAVTHAHRGRALEAAGRKLEAMAAYEAAIKRDPNDAHSLFALGTLQWEELELGGEAEKSFADAARILPAYADAHFNLGVVRLQRGRHAAAIEPFREALRLAPPGTPWIGQARRALKAAMDRSGGDE